MSRYESICILSCVVFLVYGIMLIVGTMNPPGSIFFSCISEWVRKTVVNSFIHETIQAQAFQLEKIDFVTDEITVYL